MTCIVSSVYVFFHTSRDSFRALLAAIGHHPVMPCLALPVCLNPTSHGCSDQTDPFCISAEKTSLLLTEAVTCAEIFTNELFLIFIATGPLSWNNPVFLPSQKSLCPTGPFWLSFDYVSGKSCAPGTGAHQDKRPVATPDNSLCMQPSAILFTTTHCDLLCEGSF